MIETFDNIIVSTKYITISWQKIQTDQHRDQQLIPLNKTIQYYIFTIWLIVLHDYHELLVSKVMSSGTSGTY